MSDDKKSCSILLFYCNLFFHCRSTYKSVTDRYRRCDTATAQITIQRNTQSPRFERTPNIMDIDRNALAGTFVNQTTGVDPDRRVCIRNGFGMIYCLI